MNDMRIDKSQAIAALEAENRQLESQREKCRLQIDKFTHLGLDAMSGKSVEAAQQSLRMHASIVNAHLAHYDALLAANDRNRSLIGALPESSSGVVDTSVASTRIENARRQIRSLRRHQRTAIEQAQRTNEAIRLAMAANPMEAAVPTPPLVDVEAIRQRYQALIEAQEEIVRTNQEVLDQAFEYDRASLDTYRSVDVSFLDKAICSSGSFVATGSWGSTAWASTMHAFLALRAKGDSIVPAEVQDLAQSYLRGDLKTEVSVLSGEVERKETIGAIVVSGGASGGLLGMEASLKPYSKGSKERGDESKDSATFGAKGSVEAYAAKGKVQADAGFVQGEDEVKVLTGALSGSLGASLFSEGSFAPGFEAKATAEGSVFSNEASVRVGTQDFNAHVKGEGKVLTGKAEAKFHVGDGEVEAKAGAEAYVATGELSGGLTLFGVKLDASVEAKAGGAGAKAGGKVGLSSAEGELGLGVLLGLGVKVKVDWSGAQKALYDIGSGIGSWWDGLPAGRAA